MKYIFTTLIATITFACNEAPKKDIPGVPYNPMDYQHTEIVTVYEPPFDTTKILLTATDDKKTWTCNFYINRINLMTNKNKDTFSITNDLNYAVKNNMLLNPSSLTSKDKSFILKILAETCNGETDDEVIYTDTAKKIIIMHDKVTLKGCVHKVN